MHPTDESSGNFIACISSRITTVIQVVRYNQVDYNWYNEPFAVSLYNCLYLDMHGLIFETSVWLLAGSTRLIFIKEKISFMLPLSIHKWTNKASIRNTFTFIRSLTSSITFIPRNKCSTFRYQSSKRAFFQRTLKRIEKYST